MRKLRLCDLAVLLATVLALGGLAGCGGGGGTAGDAGPAGDPAGAAEDSAGQVVTLSFLRAGTDELAQLAYADLIAEYTAGQPNVAIDYQQYGFGAELETKMNTLYASGSAPDVVRAPISTIAQRAAMGQYAPLDDYIAGWSEKDNILPNAYEVGSYKGKNYGIAINIESNFLFYRKDHFLEAGLDPDRPPTTWEELYEYAEQLTVREGDTVTRMGWAFPIAESHHTLMPFARQNGAVLVDEENDLALFNEPETAEALAYLARYSADNLLIPYINGKDQNPFELGRGSMTFGSLGTYTTIQASGVEWVDQLLFAPMVSREYESNFGGCQIMFLSEESLYKDEAWGFLEFLFTDEAVWKLVDEAGATPVKLTLADRYAREYPEIGLTYLESLNAAKGMPKVEWSALFQKHINVAYEEAMYGRKDAQAALDDALVQLNAEIGAA